MAEVALDARYTFLPLHFLVNVDWHAEVLDMGVTWDACDIGDVVLREHLGFRLVQLQIPHSAEVIELLDRLGHLRLGVGQDQHVVGERQQVTSVDYLSQLLGGAQRLFEIDVEQHGREDSPLDHSEVRREGVLADDHLRLLVHLDDELS